MTMKLNCLCLCALLLCSIAGCGGKPSAVLTGKIMSGASPVGHADVYLEHKTDPEAKFFGLTLDDGEIQIDVRDGIQPGFYDIVVTTYQLKNGSPLPEGEEGEVAKEDGLAVKQEFTFKRQLEIGANELNLDIEKADG
jgi:hypothetical protein